MIAQELEVILHQAFVDARARRHEYITVEHLLFGVLNSPSAGAAVAACGADLQRLRKDLAQHIAQLDPADAGGREVDTQPTQGFQRVIQRAILVVQSARKNEVGSVDVLLAIFGEQKSHAAQLLQQHSVTRQEIANRMNRPGEPATEPLAAPSLATPAAGSAISRELEVTLHAAFFDARQKRHEFITVEHLLLALLDDPASAAVLRGCVADMEALRRNLGEHIAKETPQVPADREVDTQPTLGFQRVLQRAILHVQPSGREVTGANLLVAIFGEKDSYAVRLLQREGADRLTVVTYVSHGAVSKPQPMDLGDASEVQVVIYNDDYTPMEFVVRVLQEFFGMDADEAKEAMLEIHREGASVCGLYSREDGQALVEQVLAFARDNGHPLVCEAVVPK
jgi:ATP-dependent Clp protease ATP-binding subunit ClpA